MITKEELKHYRELGYKDIVLDINKNPSSRKDLSLLGLKKTAFNLDKIIRKH